MAVQASRCCSPLVWAISCISVISYIVFKRENKIINGKAKVKKACKPCAKLISVSFYSAFPGSRVKQQQWPWHCQLMETRPPPGTS